MKIFCILFLFSCHSYSEKTVKKSVKLTTHKTLQSSNTFLKKVKYIDFFKKVFQSASYFKERKIDDPINEKPVNLKVLEVYNSDKKLIGYIRDVVTSTGCGGPCLPVVFTLFYSPEKKLIELLSRKKLTKKNHVPFKFNDYLKLKDILALNPQVFKKIGHPTEMVDAISGATRKEYKEIVVEKAAYTTLRVNAYNQQTLLHLINIKSN